MINPPVTELTLEEPSLAGVSWAAVAAGAVAACAVTLVLIAFGTGLGLSTVSPWAGAGVSATTFKIGTGLYLIVIAMIASSIGGYLAGRLRTRWIGVSSDEVYFRDTAHGFVSWAFASVIGAILLATPATSLLGNATSGAAQGAAAQTSSSMDPYMDTLLRRDPAGAGAQQGTNESRAELTRLFSASSRDGTDLKQADRDYVVRLVAARTGLAPADADRRVTEVVNQLKTDLDAARKAAAQLAFWLTASLLVGAFCASLAATEGGGLRDGTWGRKLQR